MKRRTVYQSSAIAVIVLALSIISSSPSAMAMATHAPPDDHRMDWWRAARFGMFIHWGLYSIPAGEWNGQTNHAEWIRTTAQIPVKEYEKFETQFDPKGFDADQWARMAADAGMKYVVITTKHHDGFCLFDSKYTDFDVMSTPFKRDIMKEMSEAVRAHGLKMCWYYSIMDWHHPDYLPRRSWEVKDRPIDGAQYNRYVDYLRHQVTELLTNYGDIGVMWFDGEWENTWTHQDGLMLYQLCRSLQPNVIVNNRVDTGRSGMAGMTAGDEFAGDFGTPEQEVPARGVPGVDWETCMTMNDHWGYNRADQDWKSSKQLIRTLVDVVSKGGNFLLNVGPRADGTFPPEAVSRLRDIGDWMKVNSDSIYGTTTSPFAELSFGRCTQKTVKAATDSQAGITNLYLHIFDWPANNRLVLPGLRSRVLSASILGDSRGRQLRIEQVTPDVTIFLPVHDRPDEYDTVVVAQIAGKPDVFDAPTITSEGNEFVDTIRVSLSSSRPDAEIRYSLNGLAPTGESYKYTEPFDVVATCSVRAQIFEKSVPMSEVSEKHFTKVQPWPGAPRLDEQPGIIERVFAGDWQQLPDFKTMNPQSRSIVASISLDQSEGHKPSEHVGYEFAGLIDMPDTAMYRFSLTSDDGARLWIDDHLVVDNDGLHAAVTRSGSAPLAAGLHEIRVGYFNRTGAAALSVSCGKLGQSMTPVNDDQLFHR